MTKDKNYWFDLENKVVVITGGAEQPRDAGDVGRLVAEMQDVAHGSSTSM